VPTSAIVVGSEIRGRATVIDGDTIDISSRRIRFWDVDAPERAQECETASGEKYPCGEKAAHALTEKIGTATVICNQRSVDRVGRIIAICSVEGDSLSVELVSQGHALAVRRRSGGGEYVPEEDAAREAKKGLWAGAFTVPWEWRAGIRRVVASARPAASETASRSSSSPVQADEVSEARAMFNEYISRSDRFDARVADLYSDDAAVRSTRIMPDGQKPVLSFTGTQWKALIRQAMPLAQQRGDRNTFQDVSAALNGKDVTVTAQRYSHLKAYTSPFAQTWSKDQTGAWKIKEEVTETRP
jgi:endonuclease YncB( thermonuclease family)/ketosteroid isomerase-like protein